MLADGCDLKPDNILVDANDHVKLTDFGVSAVTGENDVLTQTEGTPAFNAPEEFDDTLHVAGDKADIWSLGITIYCVAFGYLPFMAAARGPCLPTSSQRGYRLI